MNGDDKSKLVFVVQQGWGSGEIGSHLSADGLIRSKYAFWAFVTLTRTNHRLQAGRYMLSPAMSIREITDIMVEGKSEPEGELVTIPEGTNIADIGKILEKAGVIKIEDFLTPAILAEEGYLFPDTYRFKKGTLAGEVAARMKVNFAEKTADIFKKITSKKKSEAVVVASILEKEVRKETDMRLVAGIILSRVTLTMPLQIDATVAYGACFAKAIGESAKNKSSNIKYCDVSRVNLVDNIGRDSVYNTYKRTGLPRGPISNPGLQAIRAALNPTASDYLFYLSARDGTTIFSKTAAEHERNRRKYLNI